MTIPVDTLITPSLLYCDCCEMLMIRGVACHERGCPNMGARWDVEDERWIPQYECFVCGFNADVGTVCCSDEYLPDDDC